VAQVVEGDAPAPGPVTGSQARALLARGARLVDVRTSEEFGDGHLRGAANLPLDALADRLDALPDPAAPVVVYCRSGNRSAQAAALLREKGYTAVYDLGPMSNW
jgi:rhodanese-related sulfurtransferase